MPSFIIVGYVWQILGRGTFLPPYPWAALKKPILNRVKQRYQFVFPKISNGWLVLFIAVPKTYLLYKEKLWNIEAMSHKTSSSLIPIIFCVENILNLVYLIQLALFFLFVFIFWEWSLCHIRKFALPQKLLQLKVITCE